MPTPRQAAVRVAAVRVATADAQLHKDYKPAKLIKEVCLVQQPNSTRPLADRVEILGNFQIKTRI
jgi:hypothetical protein